MLVRNAFGGAYASYNNYPTGADFVVALPTTRVAVMGPAGVEYVYKDELRRIRSQINQRIEAETEAQKTEGLGESEAAAAAQELVAAWVKQEEADLALRYEREIMNPEEALSLGSISQIVMPGNLRQVLTDHLTFCLRHYQPSALQGVQREFH